MPDVYIQELVQSMNDKLGRHIKRDRDIRLYCRHEDRVIHMSELEYAIQLLRPAAYWVCPDCLHIAEWIGIYEVCDKCGKYIYSSGSFEYMEDECQCVNKLNGLQHIKGVSRDDYDERD